MINCPICNKPYAEITPSHTHTHGLTLTEFKQQYPGIKCSVLPLIRKSAPASEYGAYTQESITKRIRRER